MLTKCFSTLEEAQTILIFKFFKSILSIINIKVIAFEARQSLYRTVSSSDYKVSVNTSTYNLTVKVRAI
jgi:hypothetical protein